MSFTKYIFNNLRNKYSHVIKCNQFYAKYCSKPSEPSLDIEKLFLNKETQRILRQLTGLDLVKINQPQKTSYGPIPVTFRFEEQYLFKTKKPIRPNYRFVTKEEYEAALEEAKQKAIAEKLQMPPVMRERKPINEVLDKDPNLVGYTKYKFMVYDCTPGVSDRNRNIVVRETDGTLRKANWIERGRMNQIYNPMKDREIDPPRMFEEKRFQEILDQREYVFAMSRACLQFEPDDIAYITCAKKIYEHIDQTGSYDDFRSTRFFGPMAFYYATEGCIDKLLKQLIEREMIDDAIALIKLYCKAHPENETSKLDSESTMPTDYIKAYIAHGAQMKPILELAFQTYVELEEARQSLEEGIQLAHGQPSPSS